MERAVLDDDEQQVAQAFLAIEGHVNRFVQRRVRQMSDHRRDLIVHLPEVSDRLLGGVGVARLQELDGRVDAGRPGPPQRRRQLALHRSRGQGIQQPEVVGVGEHLSISLDAEHVARVAEHGVALIAGRLQHLLTAGRLVANPLRQCLRHGGYHCCLSFRVTAMLDSTLSPLGAAGDTQSCTRRGDSSCPGSAG